MRFVYIGGVHFLSTVFPLYFRIDYVYLLECEGVLDSRCISIVLVFIVSATFIKPKAFNWGMLIVSKVELIIFSARSMLAYRQI